MIRRSILLTVMAGLISLGAFSQKTGTIRGFVYNKANGEPIIFTNVYLRGTTYGAPTDVNGYYLISKVPAGTYTLMVTGVGYDTLTYPITVKAGEMINKKLYLSESRVQLTEFEVSAEKQERQTEVKMSMVKITPKEMKQLPSVGGETDLAQYLQVVPGVIFTGDQGGQLYIRGGSPIQNKVLLDGMIVYNPFHSIGLFSVFETDIVRNADIYTGGFNAEYGGRISSIMDITTRDGNRNKLSGKVGVSPFAAKAIIEGPIMREKEEGGTTISYLLTFKHSYLEESSKYLYSYMDNSTDTNALFGGWDTPPTGNLPFNFTDAYGKVSVNGENGSKFNIFGFNFNDAVHFRNLNSPGDTDNIDFGWNTYGMGSNFVLVPGGSPVLIQGNFAYSDYKINLNENNLNPRSSEIKGFNLGMNFTYFNGDDEVKYGIEALGYSTDFRFFNALNREIIQNENTTEIGAFFKYKLNYKDSGIFRHGLVFEPSFRLQYYASLNNISPEPRLGVKYNITENIRIKLAAGIYSQNLISANSDRDVVNLFYGFLSGPDNLQDQFVTQDGKTVDLKHKLQKANHYIGGVEYDLNKRITLNVEGYYKQFTQLTNLNRNKIFDDNADNVDKPDILKKDFIIETGDAYGVDFVFKYDYKQLFFWAVYSLGYVNRWDGITAYAPVFDRRHNVNLLGSYQFGDKLDWTFNVRWNLGSGFPFTQTQGYYETHNFAADGIGTDYTTANGDLGIQYAPLNQGRLPYYHRLDIDVQKTWALTEYSNLEVSFGITNVYNRENIFYFDRVHFERVNQLPIMPSIGLSLTF